MAWLPGAIVKKVARFNPGGSKAQLMARFDGIVEHIAVSNGSSLFTYFNTSGSPCSHFYVRKAGPQGENAGMADFEQYVDTRYRAPAQLDGNHRMISIETQGGVGSNLDDGWTVAQVNRLAWIAWQCHVLHGFPLQPMRNSLFTSRGIGYHRLGVDPWRVSGGEKWSSAYGKVCPGSSRMDQIPLIISKALAYATPAPADPTPEKDWLDMATQAEVQAAFTAALKEAGPAIVEAGIGNYLKRFFADASGTGDAIWDESRSDAANLLDAINSATDEQVLTAVQALPAAIAAELGSLLAPKA